MAQNNSNNTDDIEDSSFETVKLSSKAVKDEQKHQAAKPPSGTADKRVKAMEEAVQKAKSKQKLSGVSTEDAYSADEAETKKTDDLQKVTNTVKLKRAKDPNAAPEPDPEPNSTMKIQRSEGDDDDDDLSEKQAPLLGWQHWALLIVSLLITVAVVYVVMAP
jgi:hypothetical protein